MKQLTLNKHSNLSICRIFNIRLILILIFVAFTNVDLLAQTIVKVSSLAELREAVQKSGQTIVLKPGNYNIQSLPVNERNFPCSGSDNTINLQGVYINFPVGSTGGNRFDFTGSNIIFRGGIFEDTYANGMKEVTDFGSYNQNRTTLAKGVKGGPNFRVAGNNNKIVGIKMTIRGSFPYGYGNMYGIGKDNVAGLDKHCALLITGVGNTVDSCEFQQRAFGHVIYMQGGADKTTIKNTYIEGAVRSSNDLYLETNTGDLPKRFDYKLAAPEEFAGLSIPKDVMINLVEDGIRAYPINGSVTVENCVVKKTRGGIKLYMAKSATVTNCQVLDCVVEGYSMPSGGKIINSSGNAAYGPLIYMHTDNVSNQEIDLKILPAPYAVGNHVFAAIRGKGHTINLTQAEANPLDAVLRPIVVGYTARFQYLTTDYPNVPKGYESNYEKYFGNKGYTASGITINNSTAYPVILGKLSQNNTLSSLGKVNDSGKGNKVTSIIKTNKVENKTGFVHPGIAHNIAELNFVREKVAAGEEPWKTAFEKMKNSEFAKLDRKPKPFKHVERGAYNHPNIGSSDFMTDGTSAYTLALLWYITGKPAYAEKSRELIHVWSTELESITNHDAKLLVGMSGHQWCNAAEILKYTWNGWPQKEQDDFKLMLNNIFYPVIKDFFPAANGNWDASMMQTIMAMGVFMDNRPMFDKAVDYFLHGAGNGAITHYFNDFGECQESGRDQGHTQMGLEYLSNAAEIGYKQGIDLYGAADNRLALGFEYTAKYNIGEEVPYKPYTSFEGKYQNDTISAKGRGQLRPMYEQVYNHYFNRMQKLMPYAKRAIEKTRPEGGTVSSLPWGTLMYAEQPKNLK